MISGFLLWCNSKTQEDVVQTQPPVEYDRRIYVLGDSLTAGYQLPLDQSYPLVLQSKLQTNGYNIQVINGGESGDTSSGLLDRIDRVMADSQTGDIALVVIWGNDGLQWLSTQQLEVNLLDITKNLQDRGLITIIGWMQIPTNLWTQYRTEFMQVYPTVAEITDSILIDFILEWVAWDTRYNLPDGIHPNASGQQIIAQTVYDIVVPILN